MTAHQAIDYALGYLHAAEGEALEEGLEEALRPAFVRIERGVGEVTRRDVALLVEAWIVAGRRGSDRPQVLPLRRPS